MDNEPQKRQSWMRRNGPLAGFLLGMALLGFLAQFQWLGQSAIGVYAVIAIWQRVPARRTFVLALLALGMVPISIIAANWLIAQNFAAYAFVLFAFGMVSMTLELRRELAENK